MGYHAVIAALPTLLYATRTGASELRTYHGVIGAHSLSTYHAVIANDASPHPPITSARIPARKVYDVRGQSE